MDFAKPILDAIITSTGRFLLDFITNPYGAGVTILAAVIGYIKHIR